MLCFLFLSHSVQFLSCLSHLFHKYVQEQFRDSTYVLKFDGLLMNWELYLFYAVIFNKFHTLERINIDVSNIYEFRVVADFAQK